VEDGRVVKTRFVILDFARVRGIDVTAVCSGLRAMARYLAQHGVVFICCALPSPSVEKMLRLHHVLCDDHHDEIDSTHHSCTNHLDVAAAGNDGEVHHHHDRLSYVFPDMNTALAWCEDCLLRDYDEETMAIMKKKKKKKKKDEEEEVDCHAASVASVQDAADTAETVKNDVPPAHALQHGWRMEEEDDDDGVDWYCAAENTNASKPPRQHRSAVQVVSSPQHVFSSALPSDSRRHHLSFDSVLHALLVPEHMLEKKRCIMETHQDRKQHHLLDAAEPHDKKDEEEDAAAKVLDDLKRFVQVVHRHRGDIIYACGTPVDGFYVLAHGLVDVFLPTPEHERTKGFYGRKHIMYVSTGAMLGIVDWILKRRHVFTAQVASTECDLLFVSQMHWLEMQECCPRVARCFEKAMLKSLALWILEGQIVED
jgi:hypothetical protein